MKAHLLVQIWKIWLVHCAVCNGLLINLGAYRNLLVDLHNRYRASERAADMKEMTWDFYLERRAGEWSEQCYWGHQSKGLGENLAMFWTTGPQMTISRIIQQSLKNWWDEKYSWSWSTQCGSACHYTQMAWANTNRIGCSLSKCANLAMDNSEAGSVVRNADYLVCFYSPPGNFIGQYPFTPGRSCSLCGRGEGCRNGLCSRRGGLRNIRYNILTNNNNRRNNLHFRQIRRYGNRNNYRNHLTLRPSIRYNPRPLTTWNSESRGSDPPERKSRGSESLWGESRRSESRSSESQVSESMRGAWRTPYQYNSRSEAGEGVNEHASEATEL